VYVTRADVALVFSWVDGDALASGLDAGASSLDNIRLITPSGIA